MSSDIIAEYVSQDEIEATEASMQRVVEDEKSEGEAINDKRKAAIRAADEEADQELNVSNNDKLNEKKLAAMQRDFDRLHLLRQVYHEAPDDVFELIVFKCSYHWGNGGLNAFRLANKRCKQAIESCTSMLTNRQMEGGPYILPISIVQRCRRIESILCSSINLKSLEGCPDGLKRLSTQSQHLSDLSPLAFCSMMVSLGFWDASVTDISVVSSMSLLEVFICRKEAGRPSIKDLSPLSSCTRLKCLWLGANQELKDLSPLSAGTALEVMHLNNCPQMTSLAPLSNLKKLKELWLGSNLELKDLFPLSACTALENLEITNCPLITSLAPLSNLKSLKELWCQGIHPQTSLLPLASCSGLKELLCEPNAVDLEHLRRRRPDIFIISYNIV